jgi:hypothetical protein
MAQTYPSQRADDTPGAGADSPVDRLPIRLRGYAAVPPRPVRREKGDDLPPGEWVLIFDTETTTDAVQRLRLGAFQLLKAGRLRRQGLFFDPEPNAVTEEEAEALRTESRRLNLDLLHVREFIEDVLFKAIYETGGTVVGFNLPFDLSRLASDWKSARRSTDKRGEQNLFWAGGFTFRVSRAKGRPRLRIKHVSSRFSFFGLSGQRRTPRSEEKKGRENPPERAYFLDVRTLAAALTGQSHSLKSLAKLLGTLQKSPGGDLGRPIDRQLIEYCLNDVQVTRECFEVLVAQYRTQHGHTRRPEHAIYSEATLGKAYLQAMGIAPFQQVQPDFDPKLLGAIMSAYFGGRSEVHRRRDVVRTLYCDFASMYPTVCTLMGLWDFVIAESVETSDATDWARSFLDTIDVEAMRKSAAWPDLTVLVEVQPDADIFPVRARYPETSKETGLAGPEPIATIGVNYLTSEKPLWFTLADCVASKLLTGKAPNVTRAVRFLPGKRQANLRSVPLVGEAANSVDPLQHDFYQCVIDLRRETQKRADEQEDKAEALRLDAQQEALKILANATSYGVFIEINVEDLIEPEEITLYERDIPRTKPIEKREAPGRFFHPLLATLITGAARLMLAITERRLLDEGLDWAFCDTDSMAFAKPDGIP